MNNTSRFRSAIALPLLLGAAVASAGNLPAAPVLGLYPASDFRISTGACSDCKALPQAMWYFRDQLIAVPVTADESKPPLVWLGAPVVDGTAALGSDSSLLLDGTAQRWQLVPRLASNRSWFNADSQRFFEGRALRVRGTRDASSTLTVRTLWPQDYQLPAATAAVQPLQQGESLQSLVQSAGGGAYQSRILWQRTPGAAWHSGQAVLGLMLNGAQGDDDEAHGGHFAVVTGTAHADGHMHDWLVNNFYNLDSVSEKGILAAVTPLDSYLADINSGQSWYRPSYMLVAVLKDGRSAAAYQQGINTVFQRFYRHDLVYDHSRANCTGISMDALRDVGWQVPQRGPTGRLQSLGAYFYVAALDGSLDSGRKIYDYLNEEQTRLYPAVAFDAAGQDLLRLVQGEGGRTLTAYEQQLASDVEAIVWVRMPQIPSTRAMGQAPVYSFDEFLQRNPKDRSQWKTVPVSARPFPQQWRKPDHLSQGKPFSLPLPVIGVVALPLALAGWLLRRRMKKA